MPKRRDIQTAVYHFQKHRPIIRIDIEGLKAAEKLADAVAKQIQNAEKKRQRVNLEFNLGGGRSITFGNCEILPKKKRKIRSHSMKVVLPLSRCQAARDGDCIHEQCPQLRDGEPAKTGRSCPLPGRNDDDRL